MRKFAFYIISLLACVGLASSCSSDDDDMDFSDGTELAIGGEEINSITDISRDMPHVLYSKDTCIIKCFHSEEEAMACKDMNKEGRKVTIPPIDWEKQTLVLAKSYRPNIVNFKNCKVIKKEKRFLVELYYEDTPYNAFCNVGTLIVANRPDLTEKVLSMKLISTNAHSSINK